MKSDLMKLMAGMVSGVVIVVICRLTWDYIHDWCSAWNRKRKLRKSLTAWQPKPRRHERGRDGQA